MFKACTSSESNQILFLKKFYCKMTSQNFGLEKIDSNFGTMVIGHILVFSAVQGPSKSDARQDRRTDECGHSQGISSQ